MVFKKTFFILSIAVLGLASAVRAVEPISFADVVPSHPASEAVRTFAQRGIFQGMVDDSGKRVAALENVMLKAHGGYFLAKLLGNERPSMNDVIAAGILSGVPADDEVLNYATWLTMLTKAFQVPAGDPPAPDAWFVPAIVVAQSIDAMPTEAKPFDVVSRGYVLETALKYERVFGARSADEEMDQQEQSLMWIRDKILDAGASNTEISAKIWENITAAESIPPNKRLDAIKHFNTSALILLDLRRGNSGEAKEVLLNRLSFFLEKAVTVMPDVAGFASDLEAIGKGL